MSLIVQKFGGTSMASTDIIKKTSMLIEEELGAGNQVIAVVSAMAGVTDSLISYVQEISYAPDSREYDAVVSTGEQISAGLMALSLKAKGIDAISLNGWQLPICTDSVHTKAKLISIECDSLKKHLAEKKVPIIAGFQGMSSGGSITTFGRGGSDLSAVAIASSMGALRCDLYKDVPGVMSADPKIVPGALLLPQISYDEMTELASLGSKILQDRAIRLASAHQIPIRIRPTFSKESGTIINNLDNNMEYQIVKSIVCNHQQSLIRIKQKVPQEKLLKIFARFDITIDMVIYDNEYGISFTAPSQNSQKILSLCKSLIGNTEPINHSSSQPTSEDFNAKISLVGLGVRSNPQIISDVFECLAEKNIEIKTFAMSDLRISILVDDAYAELATRLLHRHFFEAQETYKKSA